MIEVRCDGCGLKSPHSIGVGFEGVERVLCSCPNCDRFVDVTREATAEDTDGHLACPKCGVQVRRVTVDPGRTEQRGGRVAQTMRNAGVEPSLSRPPSPITCPACGGDAHAVFNGLWD